MRASPACIDFIKGFEKFRPTAYKPTKKDVWTIGYGHTDGVKEGASCTMDAALLLLEDDMADAENAVEDKVTAPLTQNQYDALVSFVFNVGVGAFEESTLLRKLNVCDYGDAALEFLRWDKQKGKALAGLTRRRGAEKELFEKL